MKVCDNGITKKTCAFFRAVNAGFSFSVITSIFCFVCAAAVGACFVKEKLYKNLRMLVNLLNILGFIMQFISIIIVPVMFNKMTDGRIKYFDDDTDDNLKAYWACAFLSMLFNSSAAGGCLKM